MPMFLAHPTSAMSAINTMAHKYRSLTLKALKSIVFHSLGLLGLVGQNK